MKIGDKMNIVATDKQLENVGADYLKERHGVITGFYPDGWIELEVLTIFNNELHKVDFPPYFLKLIEL